MLTGDPGMLVTRPLIFDAAQANLFVNAVVQPGGFIQIGVKGSTSLTLRASSVSWQRTQMSRGARGLGCCVPKCCCVQVGGLAPNTCVDPSSAKKLDSTRMVVNWPGASPPDLSEVAGKSVQFEIRMNAASLYATAG